MKKSSLFFNEFEESTKVKLELFELYIKEWLPVFISNAKKYKWYELEIYDFFSGTGIDEKGVKGSPLIILDIINENIQNIIDANLKIDILFNEYDLSNYEKLEANVNQYKKFDNINIKLKNLDFKVLFEKLYPRMLLNKKLPRFMFLDQFGFKNITDDIFLKLTSLERNDFLFFISSFNVKRFAELPEFNNYLSIERKEFENVKPYHAHRIVFEFYKSLIKTKYHIAPFSLKKGSNIHGLIFGSNHSLGLEKFLISAWKINKHTGDANFNIDNEPIINKQLSLFSECNEIQKIQKLNLEINKWIFEKNILSLYDLYILTMEFGCLPKHLNKELTELAKHKKIKKVNTQTSNVHKIDKNLKIELL